MIDRWEGGDTVNGEGRWWNNSGHWATFSKNLTETEMKNISVCTKKYFTQMDSNDRAQLRILQFEITKKYN